MFSTKFVIFNGVIATLISNFKESFIMNIEPYFNNLIFSTAITLICWPSLSTNENISWEILSILFQDLIANLRERTITLAVTQISKIHKMNHTFSLCVTIKLEDYFCGRNCRHTVIMQVKSEPIPWDGL